MKIYLLLFLGLICCFSAYSQTYHKLLTDSAQWNSYYRAYNNSWPMSGPQFYEYIYSEKLLKNDTIINAVHYRKTNFNRLLREDTLSKKVFLLDSTEKLLYDFSLNNLDSVKIIYNTFNWYHVKQVDSVNTLLGFRKRIILDIIDSSSSTTYNCDLIWIEGIGSTFSLDYSTDLHYYFIPDAGNYNLICAWQNEEQTYSNPNYGFCNLLSLNEITSSNKINLYPNIVTASSNITIYNDANEALEFSLYNVTGIKIFTQNLLIKQTFIQIPQSLQGIYFYSIKNSNNQIVKTGKIIVHQ